MKFFIFSLFWKIKSHKKKNTIKYVFLSDDESFFCRSWFWLTSIKNRSFYTLQITYIAKKKNVLTHAPNLQFPGKFPPLTFFFCRMFDFIFRLLCLIGFDSVCLRTNSSCLFVIGWSLHTSDQFAMASGK